MDFESKPRVLVVDDEDSQREAVSRMIERWGFTVETAANGFEAIAKVHAFHPDTMVMDLIMPGMDGMELLRRLKEEIAYPPSVIVLTAYGGVDNALATVHDLGAFWFVEKPVKPRAFRVLLERAVSHRRLVDDKERLERQLSLRGVLGQMVGNAPAMQEVFFLVRQAAPAGTTILITGESGTGKEVVARAIHELSARRGGPFIAISCAALPESLMESELFGHERGAFTGAVTRRAGCFELAQGGTLLLDEIGELPVGMQAKLLRVLESRSVRPLGGDREIPVDARVVACTNRDLLAMASRGEFREDLYYRLSPFQIPLPPLRQRLEDLSDLCAAILADLNQSRQTSITQLDAAVLQVFRRYHWPGNIRELRNVLERAAILAGSGEIEVAHLPRGFGGLPAEPVKRVLGPVPTVTLPVGTTLEQAERELIEITLAHTRNNRTRAAEILGVSAKTLYNRLKDYGAISEE
jgi:DNA-binding NtrC family response regulator